MDLQTDAVPEAVAEVVGVAGVGDDLPRRGVHVTQRNPGRQRLAAGLLRGGHQLIDVELPLRGRRQHKGARHVGVVAAHQGAEVDLDEIAGRQDGVGRPMVRDRGVGAGRHDGLERHPVGAVVQHQRLELAAHLALGAPGPQTAALDQVGQRGIGRLAGQPQQRDLAGILDLPQRLDRPAARTNSVSPACLGQRRRTPRR